ncbi:NUDIX hydrolase domain-like protein [Lipomyces arxii]|uniref:NUDIX hydrolase domain-like protein n=1 Tax=Lipomyces arxii TaxID=56418 RepID=UPI0034CE228A
MSLVAALKALSEREELQLVTPENNDPAGTVASGAIRHSAVSLIVRFNSLVSNQEKFATVQDFLDHVNDSDAEVLLIKRSTRDSDRWSGHIALPGGRRDPEDESDLATAKRETMEEVGLDLDKYGMYVGPLGQRYVTAHWGGQIIMVLCTYVFVITTTDPIPLQLQESEVALAFWTPLSYIADPANQTRYVREPGNIASSRMRSSVLRALVRSCVGKLYFAGIHISPEIAVGHHVEYDVPKMTVWGLTHRIIVDFLDLAYPATRAERPLTPYSGQLDTRLFMKLFSRRDSDEGGFGGSDSVWSASKGYIVDRYYGNFAIAVALACALRCSVGVFMLVKIVLKLKSLRRRL